jgi:signal transduction histidine kinase
MPPDSQPEVTRQKSRLSIRAQLIIAMNAVAIIATVFVGWQSAVVVSDELEERFIEDSVTNGARLAAEMQLPVSDRLMGMLGQILNCEVCTVRTDNNVVVASSLDDELATELQEAISRNSAATQQQRPLVTIDGQRFRLGTASLKGDVTQHQAALRLVLLMPEARVMSARESARDRIALMTLIAIFGATLCATLIGGALARPIQQLAARMETVTPETVGALPTSTGNEVLASTETQRLSDSFERLLERLTAARSQLDLAARLAGAGQLSAAVAHELRNPLSGIKMTARVLLDEPELSDDGRHSVELMLREIERMEAYLSELLGLHDGPDTDAATFAAVDLHDVVSVQVQAIRERAAHQHVDIAFAGDGSAATVSGVDHQLQQVVHNLLTNAVDAAGGQGNVEVELSAVDPDRWRVTVHDTGAGIDSAVADRLFEPFATTKIGGGGLGLTISRQIILRHDGVIDCKPRPEGGSSFWFELPQRKE